MNEWMNDVHNNNMGMKDSLKRSCSGVSNQKKQVLK